ncbi:GNAT family N-acetyltransferase, partial [Bacteroidales bacterium OttesenSCG-928-C19]|nr:GNAT family N-acetyltransferase [Bacteroidales bacterium OttesenSCG-928-C19]
PEERLDFEMVLQRGDERYRMSVILDEDENPVGILFFWEFAKFIYIEHLAFSHNQRGKGWGSRVLKEFMNLNKLPVVLEIELPETTDAQRRLVFYERLGFVRNNYRYIQPPYSDGKPSIEMLVMSTNSLTEDHFEEVRKTLHRDVYKAKI